jgi:hypothetical protein
MGQSGALLSYHAALFNPQIVLVAIELMCQNLDILTLLRMASGQPSRCVLHTTTKSLE